MHPRRLNAPSALSMFLFVSTSGCYPFSKHTPWKWVYIIPVQLYIRSRKTHSLQMCKMHDSIFNIIFCCGFIYIYTHMYIYINIHTYINIKFTILFTSSVHFCGIKYIHIVVQPSPATSS